MNSPKPYDDFDLDFDIDCPECNHSPTHSRDCTALGCQDGFIDLYDEDPINLSEGEEIEPCRECWGAGIERWCPECGEDIQKIAYELAQKEETEKPNV